MNNRNKNFQPSGPKRGFLVAIGSALLTGLAGCSQVSTLDSARSLGETATFSGVEVTALEAMKADELVVNVANKKVTEAAPSGATFVLFKLSAHNNDITDQEGPVVSTMNYDTLDTGEEEMVPAVNDIRVYGSGEGGHLPEIENLTEIGYDGIAVGGKTLPVYPASPSATRPQLSADETVSGWVFGLIQEDTTPELRVNYKDNSATWSADSAQLTTPN